MELNNEFEVAMPVDDAWAVLTDIEKIAPCMPGAELKEVEGDEYRGVVKVKVGPITASYKGIARFEDLDAKAHKAVLKAEGRETRGQGNATALITATLSPSTKGTKVEVATDLAITGKVAQFGRGVLADVSAKLLDQFVHNLESTVLASPDASCSRQRRRPAASPMTLRRLTPTAPRQPRRQKRSPPRRPGAAGRRRRRRRRRRRAASRPGTRRGPGAGREQRPGRAEGRAQGQGGREEGGRGSGAVEGAGRGRRPPPDLLASRRARRSRRRGGRIGHETPRPLSDGGGHPAHRADRRLLAAAPPAVSAGRPGGSCRAAREDPAGSFRGRGPRRRRQPGRDPELPVARGRHADADAVLARRAGGTGVGEPPRVRRRSASRRGRGRRGRARGCPCPLRGAA